MLMLHCHFDEKNNEFLFFVNDIKHFRVRIEGMTIKKAKILSENALLQDHFKHIEDISDKKILL